MGPHFKLLALPAPIPFSFVGVLTDMNIISALDIFAETFVEKLRFLKVSSLKEDYHPLAKQ